MDQAPSTFRGNMQLGITQATSSSQSFDSKTVQNLLLSLGIPLPKYGADGKWGVESDTALKNTAARYSLAYKSSSRNGTQVIVWPADLVPKLQAIKSRTNGKATGTTPVSADSSTQPSVDVQKLLLTLGASLPKYGPDGKWGKESDAALRTTAAKYGFVYKSSARSGSDVIISPSKLISQLTGVVGKPYDSKQVQQLILNAGISLPKYGVDGKWGKESANGLQQAASKYGLAYKSSIRAGTSVLINPAELIQQLKKATAAGEKPAPTAKVLTPEQYIKAHPTYPGKPGKIYVTKAVQKLLNKLGAKLKVTGIYSTDTLQALGAAASKIGITAAITAIPMTHDAKYPQGTLVIINPDTLIPALYKKSIEKPVAEKPAEKPAEKQPKKPVVHKAGDVPKGAKGVGYTAKEIQQLLIALGAKTVKATGKFSAADQSTLAAIVKKHGLPAVSVQNFTWDTKKNPERNDHVAIDPGSTVENLQRILLGKAPINGPAKTTNGKKVLSAADKKKIADAVAKAKKADQKAKAERARANKLIAKANAAAKAAKTAQEKAAAAALAAQAKQASDYAAKLEALSANANKQAQITITNTGGGGVPSNGAAIVPTGGETPAEQPAAATEQQAPTGGETAPTSSTGTSKGLLIAGGISVAFLAAVAMMLKKPRLPAARHPAFKAKHREQLVRSLQRRPKKKRK